jgi:hypothetical protein
VGTPRGSDDGCTGQGGVAGFSLETVGGGGVEKMAELRWAGRASTSPAAGGDDGGGEA